MNAMVIIKKLFSAKSKDVKTIYQKFYWLKTLVVDEYLLQNI